MAFLKAPLLNGFEKSEGKKWKSLGFLGEIFQTQTQTKDG